MYDIFLFNYILCYNFQKTFHSTQYVEYKSNGGIKEMDI